jgi:glutamyl-tRNA synthetase
MAEELSLEALVRAFALRNAAEHDGEAKLSSVLGSVFSARPDAKSRAGDVARLAKTVIAEVNSLPPDRQLDELKNLSPPASGEKAHEAGLPELPGAEIGNVVMRLAPYPSGPLHLGRARMAILNDEYVRRYQGKLILVIDDTAGSADKIPIPEAYESIPKDLVWLGVGVHETVYKSDRLGIFYEYAERFLREGWAYVCRCRAEELRKNRAEARACACRPRSVEENIADWQLMLSGEVAEGEAVVRLKTDMQHPDAAFRDRVLLRISERPHPRVGTRYRVWPMLEFSWAIDDHLLGITHVLRGKDLMMEDRMEEFMWDLLGWPHPVIVHHGMLGIADAKISSSECRRRIEQGKYEGWEDPRTWTLGSMRVRGIRPEAIRGFLMASGLSLTDVQVPVESLYAENRRMIDPEANRYHMVREPVRIEVVDPPGTCSATLSLHPDFPERGTREVAIDPSAIYVDCSDYERFKGQRVRLKDLYNVTLDSRAPYGGSDMERGVPKIQWVSAPHEEVRVVMPDGCRVEGLAEPAISALDPGCVVQFVRFGFCRLDSREGPVTTFRYAHN